MMKLERRNFLGLLAGLLTFGFVKRSKQPLFYSMDGRPVYGPVIKWERKIRGVCDFYVVHTLIDEHGEREITHQEAQRVMADWDRRNPITDANRFRVSGTFPGPKISGWCRG